MITRRDFLKYLGLGTMGAATAAALSACANDAGTTTGGTTGTTGNTTNTLDSLETQTSLTTGETTGDHDGNIITERDSTKKTMARVAALTFETLDPFYYTGQFGSMQGQNLYADLWGKDPDVTSPYEIGYAAKSWEVGGADNKEVTVEIYDYIKDSDGNAITAADIVWYNTFYQSIKSNPYITAIEQTGDYTFKITLKDPYYPGALRSATSRALKVLSQKAYEANPDRFRNNPACTGPYTCVEFTSGSKATFLYNHDFWQTDDELMHPFYKANIDCIGWDVITEEAQRQTAIETNLVQMTTLNTSTAEDLLAADACKIVKTPQQWPGAFVLNNYPGSIFADNYDLRAAVAYCLDYESMCLAQTRGLGQYTGIMCNDAFAGYNPQWADIGWHRDMDKAKEHFEKSGYKPGELTIRWGANYQNDTPVIMQANLAELGINLEINYVDEATFLTYRGEADQLKWDIIGYGLLGESMSDVIYSNCDLYAYSFGPICGAYDEENYELAYKARYSGSAEDLDKAYRTMHQKIYYIPQWEAPSFYGLYKKIDVLVRSGATPCIQACKFAADWDVFYEV